MQAVVIHDQTQAAAALAAAGPAGVTLLSSPGAAASLGAGWFAAIVAAAAAVRPYVPHRAVLDCADSPGLALAALRAGFRWLVLAPGAPARAQIQAVAAACGATLLPARPAALDLAGWTLEKPAARAALAAWLKT